MLQRVLNKMPQGKVKKAELRSAKPMAVKLAKLKEIDEALNDAERVTFLLSENKLSDSINHIKEVNDYVKQQSGADIAQADDLIYYLVQSLDELGVEYPDELVAMQDRLNKVYDDQNDLMIILGDLASEL